jgi:hypothetical protein
MPLVRQARPGNDWMTGPTAVLFGMTPFLGWYRAGSGHALCDRILDGYDVPAGTASCNFVGAQITDLWTFPGRAAVLLASALVVAVLAQQERQRFQPVRALAVVILVFSGLQGVVAPPGFGVDDGIRDTYAPQLGAWVALVLAVVVGVLWLHGEFGRLRAGRGAGMGARPRSCSARRSASPAASAAGPSATSQSERA